MHRSAVAAAVAVFLLCSGVRAGVLAEKADAAGARREAFVEGSNGWRFLPAELRFADKLASPDISSQAAPAIGAISDFAAQLKAGGIVLVVVPVPPKVLVQPAALGIGAEDGQKMRAGWDKIIGELAAADVQTIDLLPDYSSGQDAMFCQRDTHWSGPGIAAAVARLIPALETNGLVSPGKSAASSETWKETSINGDLGGAPENVKLRFYPSGADTAAKSSLLLLGDSHVLVFHEGGDLHASGAGLPEQISGVLGGMPEVIGVRGSGATSSRFQLARRVRSMPDYLKGIKIVVWVFAGREFTEADMWKKIAIFGRKQGA